MLFVLPPTSLLPLYSNQYAQSYYGIVIYLFLAAALCGLLAGLAYVFSLSSVQDTEKRSEYECGFEPFDSATRLPFDVHFYLVGILFLIFDVEIALLFPWVLGLQTSGWFGFYLMLGFLFILAIGFLYEWKRGALIWPSRQQKHHYITATNTSTAVLFGPSNTPILLSSFLAVVEILSTSASCAVFGLLPTSRTSLPTSAKSNTKALLLLQFQRKLLLKAKAAAKLTKLSHLFNAVRPNTHKHMTVIFFKTRKIARSVSAFFKSLSYQTAQQLSECRNRNFTDEDRIVTVSEKIRTILNYAVHPFLRFASALKQKASHVLNVRGGKRRAPEIALPKTKKRSRASQQATIDAQIARRAKQLARWQKLYTDKNQPVPDYASFLEFLRKLAKKKRQERLARKQKRGAQKIKTPKPEGRTSVILPVIEIVSLPTYANQFFGGFGVELLFTALIACWLTYLALQLGGEKSKRALSLESLTFFSGVLQFIIFCYLGQLLLGAASSLFHGYFLISVFTTSLKLLTAYSGRFILKNSKTYVKTHTRHLLEYPTILALAILFMVLLVSSSHLISGFLSLVGFSLNLYVLILFDATTAVAREAGVKYFYLSTWSSGLMLYGIFLIFLTLGTGQLQEIGQLLSTNILCAVSAKQLLIALVFLFTGLFFKLSAFPGHMWAAEVYEGAADPITAFFMLPTKVAVLAFVINILAAAFTSATTLWQPLLAVSAAVSLIWGCVAAYGETKTKRFLAYASINQIGFLLLGLATGSYEGYRATLFYLFIYAIMNLGFLTVFLNLRRPDRTSMTYLTDFRGYAVCIRSSWSLSVILLSMAGIPPLAGFFGKYYLLLHAQEQTLYGLVIIGLFTSLISTYYYLRLIKIMWFEKFDTKTQFHPLNETSSLQLQMFEWTLWAVALFVGPIMLLTDAVTESLFTPSQINTAVSGTIFFFMLTPAQIRHKTWQFLILSAHLLGAGFALALLAVSLTVLYHLLVALLASWTIFFVYVVPAAVAVFASGVTILKQPTHNLLCLIAVFFVTVLLYLYVEAEFLAFLFLIVYVGAIAVLFLFVIMLLHLKEAANTPLFTAAGFATAVASTAIVLISGLGATAQETLEEFAVTTDSFISSTADTGTGAVTWFVSGRFEDIRVFSDLLYTYHCVLFFIAALLLLTAMLGAIILATQATDKEEGTWTTKE